MSVSATVGGVDADVQFAGLAPFFAGLYQVNVQIPTSAPMGASVPIKISAAGVVSNEVTLAVGDFPLITSVVPDRIFRATDSPAMILITVNGSGFYDGGTFQADGEAQFTLPNPNVNQFQFYMIVDTLRYNPGFSGFTVTNPQSRGGGASNVKWLAFLGNLNTLAPSSTDAFQFDYAAAKMYKFRLSDGQLVAAFPGRRYGPSFDDATSYFVGGAGTVVVAFRNSDGSTVFSWSNKKQVMAVAAKGGYACFSQDFDGLLSVVDLTYVGNEDPSGISVGARPWNVAMTNLPSDGLVCAVFNIEDLALSVAKVIPSSGDWFTGNRVPPQLRFLRSVALTGLTPASQIKSPLGGSQLAVFGSGPQSGKAVVLHQTDKILVWVDVAVAQELRRVALNGSPFRLAADNANGSAIVAFADTEAGLTRFVKVAPDGTVVNLSATVDFLATGFAVSADGTNLYVSNRDKFRILANH